MSRTSQAANGLMSAIEDVCGLWGVHLLRMQSRTFTVTGAAGRSRPMFCGEWTDDLGYKHRSGMADFLAMPRTSFIPLESRIPNVDISLQLGICSYTAPLWIEAKTGSGKLTPDQQAFKEYVEHAGAFHLELHDSADELMEWFKNHGVKKR